jgi:hypothetical protein
MAKYSQKDDIMLMSLRREGMSFERIGEYIGRHGKSVSARYYWLTKKGWTLNEGLTQKQIAEAIPATKLRKCLCCGRSFNSEGPGNRLCQSCRHTASSHDHCYMV